MKLQQSHWAVYFLFWLLTIVGGGALVGLITFPIFAPVFGSTGTPISHALAGARHLSFIALIWAPGIALVLCVMRAYRNKQPLQ
ncbi:MAG: hypothetical protein IPP19_16940 [Verrucomicrobia bacterium]|nr:hypothetical protein [Verrucomicrobiota bacterium]